MAKFTKKEIQDAFTTIAEQVDAYSNEHETVPLGVYKQVQWERDLAVGQLQSDYHVVLGQSKPYNDDDVISRSEVVKRIKKFESKADGKFNTDSESIIAFIESVPNIYGELPSL